MNPERGFTEPPMPRGRYRDIMAPPPPPRPYPTGSFDTLRDAAITQSHRALDLLREYGLPTP